MGSSWFVISARCWIDVRNDRPPWRWLPMHPARCERKCGVET